MSAGADAWPAVALGLGLSSAERRKDFFGYFLGHKKVTWEKDNW
jgi:hypothetical protein